MSTRCSSKCSSSGFGLGLAIAKRAIRALRGAITARNDAAGAQACAFAALLGRCYLGQEAPLQTRTQSAEICWVTSRRRRDASQLGAGTPRAYWTGRRYSLRSVVIPSTCSRLWPHNARPDVYETRQSCCVPAGAGDSGMQREADRPADACVSVAIPTAPDAHLVGGIVGEQALGHQRVSDRRPVPDAIEQRAVDR